MSSSSITSEARQPGFIQGIMLLLPITMYVIGTSVFTATISVTQEFFKDVPHANILVNLMQTMPAIWVVIFATVAGWLADRFGRMKILLWAMFIYAIVGTVPFFLENIYLILVTRCAVGICEAVVLVSTTAMIGDYFSGRSRERWLAGQTGLATLAAIFVVWAGGVLGGIFGWQGPFLIYMYSFVLAFGVAFFCWEPPRRTAKEEEAEGIVVLFTKIPMARMLGICAVTVFGSLLFYTPITQNANAFVSLGLHDTNRIGQFSSLAALGVPVGTVIFWFIGRIKTAWLLLISFALNCFGFYLMSRATTAINYTWAAQIQQLGCGLILPTLLVWAQYGMAFSIRGRAVGMWQAAYAVGLFVSGATITIIATALGQGNQLAGMLPAFGKLSIACGIAAVVALISGVVKRSPASTASA
jgi:predicted MFS family arabinose efflux permease